jgi:hypothetical protein
MKKMKNRESDLLSLRNETLGAISNQSSVEESFQNKTLRPILKLQNDLFIVVFSDYITQQKGVFYTLSTEKKLAYIENVIQRDVKFRNVLKGIILGIFTIVEYKEYLKNSSNLNKRMMTMLIERLQSNLLLFDI